MSVDTRYSDAGRDAELRFGISEVTTQCPFRCPGCYMVRRNALNDGAMTLEEAIRVLDLCKQYKGGEELETMDILGGEPLLWPHLKPYLSELLRRGILPWIFTNMVTITPEMACWLFERRVHITGKLNIADPGDPEQIRLQAEMIGRDEDMARRMIEGIQVFLDAGYRDPLFRLQNLVRKKNLRLIPGYIEFCRSRGIGVDLELMGSGEPISPEYFVVAPTAQELADLIRELKKRGEQTAIPEFCDPVGKLLMPHVFGSCPFYDKGLYFAVDGHIRSCSNSTVKLAHVSDADPIRAAYESPLICARKALTKQTVGQPCGSCDRWDKCRGGCRATVEGMGDPFGGYTLCPLPLLRKSSE
ncbi:MAG: radical SAM protein [Candidatus Peribacter sp.]|nr:radical SAM protein [Candidatus Peribacter sp.]